MADDGRGQDESSDIVMANVSVVMPAYNAAGTILASIKSAQDVGIERIIVVDDGSSDSTGAVATAAGAHVIRQSNAGAAVARRSGLDHVVTDFVILLDSDDRLLPGIRESVSDLAADHSVGVVGGRYIIAPSKGRRQKEGPETAPAYDLSDLLVEPRSAWPPCTAVWRTEAIRSAIAAPPLPLQLGWAEDYELLIRVAAQYRIIGVSRITAEYMTLGGKSTTSAVNALMAARDIRDYYASYYSVTVRTVPDSRIVQMAAWRVFRAIWASEGVGVALARWLTGSDLRLNVPREFARRGALKVRHRSGGPAKL